MKGVYVFVVCGSAEHIDTLHYALPFLQNRTKNRILVVTDSTRNEVPITHGDVVDVLVPTIYDHHQASIWLKTSLHKLLPSGERYVYLDTDILAIGNHPDGIFDEYIAPIRFAADHCRMKQFSPYAVNCPCFPENLSFRDEVNKLMAIQDPLTNLLDPALLKNRADLQKAFQKLKQSKVQSVISAVKFMLAGRKYTFTSDFYFDKRKKIWYTNDDEPVMHQISMKKIAASAGLKYNRLKNDVLRPDGRSIWRDSCVHLQHYILDKFGVDVKESDWQHWNGGVFLFSDESKYFMDTWHAFTLEIFKDPAWKTRDQGTLIATVWKLGLQKQPVLDDMWNFIADFYNTSLQIDKVNGSISKDSKNYKKPELIHIYHHFGDEGWAVWKWASEQINKK